MKNISKLSWVSSLDCVLLAIACTSLSLYYLRENHDGTKSSKDVLIRDTGENISSTEDTGSSLTSRNFFKTRCCKSESVDHGSKETKKAAVGLYLFIIGSVFAAIELLTTNNEDQQYNLPLRFFGAPVALMALEDTTYNDWLTGFLGGALPQIPLTTLNSVVSVCCLAHSLFPEKRTVMKGDEIRESDAVVTRKEVAISVGLMNIFFCPFGSIPNCHGAGGLAGQTAMGAKGGSSVVILGFAKMTLAVFFGASALTLLDALPISVLGVMLVIAGLELASTGLTLMVKNGDPQSLRKDSVVTLVTAAVILALNKTHYGAIAGWFTFMIYGNGFEQFIGYFRSRRLAYKNGKNEEYEDTLSDGSLSADAQANSTNQGTHETV